MNTSHTAIPPDLARTLIAAAVLAPSSHNTQPWLFAASDQHIDLIADRRRALPVNDPHDRELTISCGCALFNLRVAAAAAGFAAQVALCPDADDEDVLARVRLAAADTMPPDAKLHAAIAQRRTVRQRFASGPLESATIQALIDAAAREGATLHTLSTHTQRHDAAALVAEGDAMQWADASWRRELAAWMHPRRRGDGLSMPALAAPVARTVVRTFDIGHGVAAKDRQLADESPLLTVLTTATDSVLDWLAAGQALQCMLLEGVERGLQASYLNQPVQVASLRTTFQQAVGCHGVPQLLMRWGKPMHDVPAAPRRPLGDVIDER